MILRISGGARSFPEKIMASPTVHKFDAGRLLMVPLFTFFLAISILGAREEIKALGPVNLIKAAGLIHRSLTLCSYIILIVVYFLRSSARATTNSLPAKLFAVVATFLPRSEER